VYEYTNGILHHDQSPNSAGGGLKGEDLRCMIASTTSIPSVVAMIDDLALGHRKDLCLSSRLGPK
jgi:hypothetical protein